MSALAYGLVGISFFAVAASIQHPKAVATGACLVAAMAVIVIMTGLA